MFPSSIDRWSTSKTFKDSSTSALYIFQTQSLTFFNLKVLQGVHNVVYLFMMSHYNSPEKYQGSLKFYNVSDSKNI